MICVPFNSFFLIWSLYYEHCKDTFHYPVNRLTFVRTNLRKKNCGIFWSPYVYGQNAPHSNWYRKFLWVQITWASFTKKLLLADFHKPFFRVLPHRVGPPPLSETSPLPALYRTCDAIHCSDTLLLTLDTFCTEVYSHEERLGTTIEAWTVIFIYKVNWLKQVSLKLSNGRS
jgi:hypothetical protein